MTVTLGVLVEERMGPTSGSVSCMCIRTTSTSDPWIPSGSWFTAITSLHTHTHTHSMALVNKCETHYLFCRISTDSCGMFRRSLDISSGCVCVSYSQ